MFNLMNHAIKKLQGFNNLEVTELLPKILLEC